MQEQYIFVSLEIHPENIRAIREKWCRPNSRDIVINSVLSEPGFCNANEVLEDRKFLADKERVLNELTSYIDSLKKTHPKTAKILTANAPRIFEHNLHELHKWAYSLNKIINASRFKIKVLFPGAFSANHLFLNEAEGETSATWIRSFLYRRTDFLTLLLKDFLNALEVDHGEYGQTETFLSRYGYYARRINRTFVMAIARGLMHGRNVLRHQRNILRTPLEKQSQLLIVVRSVIHAEFFSNLIKEQRSICLIQDGLAVYPKVLHRARVEGASQIIHCYDLVSPLKIIGIIFRLLRELLSFDFQVRKDLQSYIFTLDGMSINMTTLIKECIASSLDSRLLSISISTIASRADFQISGVAHSELITEYPSAIKAVCEKLHIPTLQFAFGTHKMEPAPNFIFADSFFCFSIDQRDAILKQSNIFDARAVCYVGNLLIDSSEKKRRESIDVNLYRIRKTILYYSQPFGESTDEALMSVKRVAETMKLSLKVVMHPRENAESFLKYGKELCILTNENYIEQRLELFNETLFAITRNSNVGYQLLMRGIPLINYMVTTKDAVIEHEYYVGYPLLARSEEKLLDILKSPLEHIEKYKTFRRSYLEQNFMNKGVNDIKAAIFR